MAPSNPASKFEIRSYRVEDQKEILAMFEAGMMLHCPEDEISKNLLFKYIDQCKESDLATIDGTYFMPGGHFWVATTTNGQVVGMVALEPKGQGVCELRRLSVHENARGQGLAKQLVAHLEQWAITQGFTKIILTTGNTMVFARKLYASLGYVPYETKLVNSTYELMCFYKILG